MAVKIKKGPQKGPVENELMKAGCLESRGARLIQNYFFLGFRPAMTF